jgi:hypothetical protein
MSGWMQRAAEDAEMEYERVKELDSRIDELEAENAKLRSALEQVEWVGEACGVFGECPWCLNDRLEGHKLDCARQSALGQSEGGRE